jgi:hypothetical protein
MNQVADNITDCFGAIDERQRCHISHEENSLHCWTGTECVSSSKLCGFFQTCSSFIHKDFCESLEEVCYEGLYEPFGTRDIFCQLAELEDAVKSFSLETARVHPVMEEPIRAAQLNERQTEDQTVEKNTQSDFGTVRRILRCNRGLSVVTWLGGVTVTDQCFCPPTYYGELCEYQNQRVSLTLRLLPVSRRSLYAFVVMLIDENGQINSYEQFIFLTVWGCSKKFNFYLLYSTRPKDMSKNYSIHIDVFDKYTLTYHASWHLPIPFIFLPVNQIAANLIIPFQSAQSLKTCNFTCNNGGECMKYVNVEKFFCHCHSNWTGPYCDIPIDCNDCSNDSLCTGSFNNRSICVCPENKVGPRCLISSFCPPDKCGNNGRCVLLQNDINAYRYFCICSDLFYGESCDYEKQKLKIVFDNIQIPSYILIYIITPSENYFTISLW